MKLFAVVYLSQQKQIIMTTAKHFLGFQITKYNNENTCYVWFYESIDKIHINNTIMGFSYAKKKFNINKDNYSSKEEEGKVIYTRK